MALPIGRVHRRSQVLAHQLARQREHEARCRQQWEQHAQYFREQRVQNKKQAEWTSRQSYQSSLSAYNEEKRKEEKRANLELRRNRLKAMLQQEQDEFEAELRQLIPDSSTVAHQQLQRTEELRLARQERQKKLAEKLLHEHWKKNNPDLRELELTLHKDHVVNQWQEQITEKKQKEVVEQEEARRFENEYERSQKEALERLNQAEEKRKAEERKRAEELRQQMEELRLREREVREALQSLVQTLSSLVFCCSLRHFLVRQYRAQLKRRAQQVQEELEVDRKLLAAMLEGEQDDQRLETVRRKQAVADAAWMKHVIEEQLQIEREREAQFEILHREEAQEVWEKREAQWEKERKARERLMHEVLVGRQQQLQHKMQNNCAAQKESLKRREELILELEREMEVRGQEKENKERRRTAWKQEINAQVQQRHQEQLEDKWRNHQEEKEHRNALRIQEEELRKETQRMATKGYQEKVKGVNNFFF
uniref:Trichoplein keratin filament-binding protein n=1 Tax=Gouania willdenowi TaxID=441366 RepID=A0A8C5N639_GOUWI